MNSPCAPEMEQLRAALAEASPSLSSLSLVIVGLETVPQRTPYVIHDVVYPEDEQPWAQRLEELGFLPGERVEVLTRGVPGGDPLAIRVGHSIFALRRAEAACVRVRPWPQD